ncbi:MAG: hypothetical protein JW727_03620 [Candidatus Aenigmarchaeota archaeon]|nr:hypothetical protein [Candidatus Aenigmarchaeota archaeon]
MSDKYAFTDNLVYPKEKEVLKYKGPEPFRFYGSGKKLFLDVFELAGKDIFEPKIKWDATGETKTFWVKWEFAKNMDSWSKLKLSITFQGCQNSRTRLGECSISMSPKFVTEVKTGFLQRYFWWMYYYLYYKNQRIYQFYRAKTIFNQFKLKVGEVYGMQVEESI